MPARPSFGDVQNTPVKLKPLVAMFVTSHFTTNPWYGPLSPCEAHSTYTVSFTRLRAGRCASRNALNCTTFLPVPLYGSVTDPSPVP